MPKQQTDASRILQNHINVGRTKAVSYLPLQTIENVIGITASTYKSLVEQSGNQCIVLGPDDCCIQSGAAYAFSETDLGHVLRTNSNLLCNVGWPVTPVEFIRRIASTWLDEGDPALPVVRKAFGEPHR